MRPSASQTPVVEDLRVHSATGIGTGAGFQRSPVAAGRMWDLGGGFGTNGAREGRAVVVRDACSLDQSGEVVWGGVVSTEGFQRVLASGVGFWCQSVPETTGSGGSMTCFGTDVRRGVVTWDAACLAHRRLPRRGLGAGVGASQSLSGGAALGCQREPETLLSVVEASFFFGTNVWRSGRAVVVREAVSFAQRGTETLVRRYVATVLMGRCQRPTFFSGDFGFQSVPETTGSGVSEGTKATLVLSGTASVLLDACSFAHSGVLAGFAATFGGVQSCGSCFAAVFGFQRPPDAFGRVVSSDIRTVTSGDLCGVFVVVLEAWFFVQSGFLISFAFFSSSICANVFVFELLSHRYVDFRVGFHSCGSSGRATRFFHIPSEKTGSVTVE